MEIKTNTHIVIKKDWINNELSGYDKEKFYQQIERITNQHNNEYLICNKDEPYACKVWEVILKGEMQKECKNG